MSLVEDADVEPEALGHALGHDRCGLVGRDDQPYARRRRGQVPRDDSRVSADREVEVRLGWCDGIAPVRDRWIGANTQEAHRAPVGLFHPLGQDLTYERERGQEDKDVEDLLTPD